MYTWTQLQLIPINQIEIQKDNYTCCLYNGALHPQILIGEFKGIIRISWLLSQKDHWCESGINTFE